MSGFIVHAITEGGKKRLRMVAEDLEELNMVCYMNSKNRRKRRARTDGNFQNFKTFSFIGKLTIKSAIQSLIRAYKWSNLS